MSHKNATKTLTTTSSVVYIKAHAKGDFTVTDEIKLLIRQDNLQKILPLSQVLVAYGTDINDINYPEFIKIIGESGVDKELSISDLTWDLVKGQEYDSYRPGKYHFKSSLLLREAIGNRDN